MSSDLLIELGKKDNAHFWIHFKPTQSTYDLMVYGDIYDMLIRHTNFTNNDILVVLFVTPNKNHTFLIFGEKNTMHYKPEDILQDFLYCHTLYKPYYNIIEGPNYSEVLQTTDINENIIKNIILDMDILNFQYHSLV